MSHQVMFLKETSTMSHILESTGGHGCLIFPRENNRKLNQQLEVSIIFCMAASLPSSRKSAAFLALSLKPGFKT